MKLSLQGGGLIDSYEIFHKEVKPVKKLSEKKKVEFLKNKADMCPYCNSTDLYEVRSFVKDNLTVLVEKVCEGCDCEFTTVHLIVNILPGKITNNMDRK